MVKGTLQRRPAFCDTGLRRGVLLERVRLLPACYLLMICLLGGGWMGCTKRKTPPPPPPLVILIGIDGFRWDYLEKFQPPTLSRLAREGVRVERLIPCFPSLTFPNFYTLATGLYPEHHGIVGNSMYDPEFGESFSLGSPATKEGKWWGGEPIWNTAQRQGLRAACMFWPGSEAEIGGQRPQEWRPYDGKVTAETRVQTVLGWLARPPGQRPHLVTLYFPEADSAAHHSGPDAPETVAAVAQIDAAIGQLLAGLQQAGLANAANLIFVSDHGMTELSPERVIALSEKINPDGLRVDFTGAVAGLRPAPEQVEETYRALAAAPEHYQVYRRAEVPERLHFRAHRRIPPLLLIADEGWFIMKRPLVPGANGTANLMKATHGFDPALPSMGASFFAIGPAFRRGVTLPPCENIHVYDLLCDLLGIQPAANDGDHRLSAQTLRSGGQ